MGEYLLSGVAIALVGIVFWAVKRMIDKTDKKIDDLKVETDSGFKNNIKVREHLKVLYLDEKTHKFMCEKTQADFKLHVSKVAENNREIMTGAIEKNLAIVTDMFNDLRKDMKDNFIKK